MDQYPYEMEHISMLRSYAAECMVLLKSDGTFPLKQAGKLDLFGSGARKTRKGGTGSGDVYARHFVTIEEGLERAGFLIATKEWMDAYEAIYAEARRNFVKAIKQKAAEEGIPAVILGMGAVMPEPEYSLPLAKDCDAAVYVLGRISGEGADRSVEKGDFQLTDTEIKDILLLSSVYEKFILILNVGSVIDLTPVQSVQNILLMSQLGAAGGDALADVLLGRSCPSGKLTATFSTYESYPLAGNFGGMDDAEYKEGIYVGYRYFDSVNKTPLYPFGYGLSWTQFSILGTRMYIDGQRITVEASVKNIGNFTGKEVIQVYVSVPEGRLDQPYQGLAAFAKTKELKAHEETIVTLTFPFSSAASFDEEKAVWFLEKGDYIIRLGNSSRNTHVCGIVRVEKEYASEQMKILTDKPEFIDWKPGQSGLMYADEKKEIEEAAVFILKDTFSFEAENKPFFTISKEAFEIAGTLSDRELAYLCVGDFRSADEKKSIIGNAAFSVAGAAGETTRRFKEHNIPSLVMADGPAGLRLSRKYGRDEFGIYPVEDKMSPYMQEFADDAILSIFGHAKEEKQIRNGQLYDQFCTALPVGTALAQSWNLELGELCGDIVGQEMERFGVHIWLAPALNIHRSPLCGRNFEYYSEDPLISGKIAAAITRGVQKHPGCAATIKHFACNNQETNRFCSNSIVSGRALREIYLRGFEICIKEAGPYALMSSYNLLNGEHTSHRKDLITGILREEWGYQGIVMTDWLISGLPLGMKSRYPYADAAASILSGHDLLMPGSETDYQRICETVTREELEVSAARVISMALYLRNDTSL